MPVSGKKSKKKSKTRKSSGTPGAAEAIAEQTPTEAVDSQITEVEILPVLEVPEALKHFEILSEIGRGGMGTVYLARDVSLDREVALKVLSPSLTQDEVMVERFVREARAQARMAHPNITHIYFIGEEHDCHFFAMELVHGKTLAEVLDKEGPPPWEKVLEYAVQAARGLVAAHKEGIVHHDVKPSNLMLTEDGTIKIADFGLARRIERDSRITGTGVITGTPAYMSPEQGRCLNTDHRSDIYSLGATIFHLIAGRPPFEADSSVATIVEHVTKRTPRLSDVAHGVPRRVSNLVARCLEKEPEHRFQSYEELIAALEDALPREVTPAGIFTRLSATVFDALVVALVWVVLPGSLGRVIFGTAYFVLLESLFGWTPGKRVMKLAVRKADGTRASPARVGLRFLLALWFWLASAGILYLHQVRLEDREELVRFVEAEPIAAVLLALLFLLYLLGLVSMAVAHRKRAFHDSLTGTLVVYELQ